MTIGTYWPDWLMAYSIGQQLNQEVCWKSHKISWSGKSDLGGVGPDPGSGDPSPFLCSGRNPRSLILIMYLSTSSNQCKKPVFLTSIAWSEGTSRIEAHRGEGMDLCRENAITPGNANGVTSNQTSRFLWYLNVPLGNIKKVSGYLLKIPDFFLFTQTNSCLHKLAF